MPTLRQGPVHLYRRYVEISPKHSATASSIFDAAEKQFQQPTHYARKILELLDVYDAGLLDEYIGIAVKENKLGVAGVQTAGQGKDARITGCEKYFC